MISKKTRDIAMRAIIDFHAQRKENTIIQPEYLYKHGLSQDIDAREVVDVLCSMGYIAYRPLHHGFPKSFLLTDSGRCYFERKSDMAAEKRAEWIRYAITTAIAFIALIIAGISLLSQLGIITLPTP